VAVIVMMRHSPCRGAMSMEHFRVRHVSIRAIFSMGPTRRTRMHPRRHSMPDVDGLAFFARSPGHDDAAVLRPFWPAIVRR
jgi:hypothetical protein